MSSFLIPDCRPVYFNQTGEAAGGGSLVFSMAGTATPQDVYGDPDLTVNNGSTLTLGTDGRTSVDVWGDGSTPYRVQLYDANGALQFDVDNVGLPGGGAAGAMPDLVTGEFLTNDGSQLLWAQVRQLPDPTGQADKILSTDGTNYTFIAKPADGLAGNDGTSANITFSANKITMNNGSGDLWCAQWGTGSASATGAINTNVTIAFPTAFAAAPDIVLISPTNDATGSGYLPTWSANNASTTGVTIEFGTNGANPGVHFNSAQNFNWIAFGRIAGT